MKRERLGIITYTNVAPLHWRFEPWQEEQHSVEFVYGVPSQLNAALLRGEIDLTLVSSIQFIRHRHTLKALPDFSIATLGAVNSVTLFHTLPLEQLGGKSIAVTTDSATGVELLRVLLEGRGINAELVPMKPELDGMLNEHPAALLIGDVALREATLQRSVNGTVPTATDLGDEWYRLTRLPFTFAVWASRDDYQPSSRLVAAFRAAREVGVGNLAAVAAGEAKKLDLPESVVQRYLANFRYYLDATDREGLAEFARRSQGEHAANELRFWDV